MSPTSTERILTSGLMTNVKRPQSAVTVKAEDAVDADSSPRDRLKELSEMLEKERTSKLLAGSARIRATERLKSYQSYRRPPKVRLQSVCDNQELSVEMAGEKDPVVKTSFRDAKKSDEGIKADTHHEGKDGKLKFERWSGVFELMIELPHSSVEGGAAKVMGAGGVESLQKERSWNLSRLMVCAGSGGRSRVDQISEVTLRERPIGARLRERTQRKDELRLQI